MAFEKRHLFKPGEILQLSRFTTKAARASN